MNRFNKKTYLCLITALFLIWAGLFIRRSSVVGIDGSRHFVLFGDAMVSMRYAWNLSHGAGLVWNKGDRIEGFTNMLMTLYMSLATAVFDKSMAALFIQLSGIVYLLAIAYFNMKIAEEIFTGSNNREFLLILSFAAALCYYPLAYWSLRGMETGLLAMLLLAGTWIVIRFGDRLKAMPVLPVLMGLAFLTRPDALIPITLIMTYRLLGIVKRKRWIGILEITILSVFIVSLTVFRWSYYGSVVPNTYTLKMTGLPFMFRIQDGIGFIGPFLKSISISIIIALLGISLNFRKSTSLLAALILSSIAYQVWVGGDPWPYWRVMSVYLPLLFVLCLDGLSDMVHRFIDSGVVNSSNRTIWGNRLEKIIVGCMFFALLAEANFKFAPEMFLLHAPFGMQDCSVKINTAIALNEITGPGASVAVFNAGVIPYYTGLKAIDMLGKSDKYIAQLPPDISGRIAWSGMKSAPGHNKYDLNYSIKTFKPTYVEGFSYGRDNLLSYAMQNYKRVRHKGVWLWLLKDSRDVFWTRIVQ